MRFIQYTRKSSEGDERQVQSIPDQNAVLARLADALGLEVVQRIEESHSAKQPGSRPLFLQMLEDIKHGKADGILCWHLNRLSRNLVDSGTLSWLLQQGLIKCIKTPGREYRPEDNVVVMAVENAVANQYIVDLRLNVRRAQIEKARRGWLPTKPPAGYFTNLDTGEIEPDPERFALIRRAWDFMLTGTHSVPEIHRLLEEWGYRTRLGRGRKGQPMTRANLYKLFDRTFYYGEFRFANERYVGRHLPMVSRAEFERVQELIHGKSFIRRKHDFAFSGLIQCGKCGCRVTAERKQKHYATTGRTVSYTYYHCTRTRNCREPSVTSEFIESGIHQILRRCQLHSAAAQWLKDDVETALRPKPATENFQVELERLRKRLAGLYDMRLAGEISAEEFKAQKARYEQTITDMERIQERSEHQFRLLQSSKQNLFHFVTNALHRFEKSDERDKREIAAAMCMRMTLAGRKLEITPHPLLASLVMLEPPETTSDKVGRIQTRLEKSYLLPWIYHIRTLLASGDVSFPELHCLQQCEFAVPSLPHYEKRELPTISDLRT